MIRVGLRCLGISPTRNAVWSNSFTRSFGDKSTSDSACEICGEKVDSDKIDRVLKERSLSAQDFGKCQAMRGRSFLDRSALFPSCSLYDVFERHIPFHATFQPDILEIHSSSMILPEAVVQEPKKGIDATGDHGSKAVPRIKELEEEGILKESDGLIDIGALNIHTIEKYDPQKAKRNIVIDISKLTPFTTPAVSNIEYMIVDAEIFADQGKEGIDAVRPEGGGSVHLLMNNFINVLPAKKGLSVVRKIFQSMRKGDVLTISGLPKERLENSSGVKAASDAGGLIEYRYEKSGRDHRKGDLYKTGIDRDEFLKTLSLMNKSKIVKNETFDFAKGFEGVRYFIIKK